MKLIVGLGNPGRKYERTRHNAGFLVAEQLVRQHPAGTVTKKFDAETCELSIADEKVLVVCPQTYMNESGRCVRKALDFYKLSLDDLLVVCDDMNLPSGRLRLRRDGSAGGQKGLADIIRHLGSDQWARLKLGIGRPPSGWEVTDYVLGTFEPSEWADIEPALKRAANAVAHWVAHGTITTMNLYNAAADT